MQSGIYVGISGQLALERRLGTIANNVANVSTAGFRAEEVKFSTVISRVPPVPVAFSITGATYLSRQSGGATQTNNPYDVTILGDAWLSIDVKGTQVYTRDGRMVVNPTGELQTVNGYSVLDTGGAPITIDPAGGAPHIGRDGSIWQKGVQVGAIGLYTIDTRARLTRAPNAGVIPDRPVDPVVEFTANGVAQGYVENSNVNPVVELTRLIAVQRAFDGISNSINTVEATLLDAVKSLGAG